MSLKKDLLNEGCIKIKNEDEEPFKLKSGKTSRIFIDIKEASLNPFILEKIIVEIEMKYFSNWITIDDPFGRIASVAIGGIPIATALSIEHFTPQVIVRSAKHNSGTESQVIGDCNGEVCVLIEDVATTGGGIVSAVTALRNARAQCNHVIVVVDREEGAMELCKEHDITLHSLLKKSDFGVKE